VHSALMVFDVQMAEPVEL